MPTFDSNPLENLALSANDADVVIDFSDTKKDQALQELAEQIEQAPHGQTLCVTFEAAKGDGTETLFQPLGRYLLELRRNGKLSSYLPLKNGSGFIFTLAEH